LDRVGVAGLRHRFSLLSGIALDVGDTTQLDADAPGLRAAAVHHEVAVFPSRIAADRLGGGRVVGDD
jgi:hypothetical protein